MFEGQQPGLQPGYCIIILFLLCHHPMLRFHPQELPLQCLLGLTHQHFSHWEIDIHFVSSSHGLQRLILRLGAEGPLRQRIKDLLLSQG